MEIYRKIRFETNGAPIYLPGGVVPHSIILSACGAEGRKGLADVISIHSRLTNQILLSRTEKQLVHNFERAR